MEWISKKELLDITGISYGQLYRWKRERLIPDSWFTKRSAVTGQETFLPRERVLERIRFIQENRETWPLNRMQELLNPSAQNHSYTARELQAFPASESEIAMQREIAGSDALTHPLAVCALFAARVRREGALNSQESRSVLEALNAWEERDKRITGAGGALTVFRLAERVFPVLSQAETQLYAPENVPTLVHIDLDDAIPKISTALSAFRREE